MTIYSFRSYCNLIETGFYYVSSRYYDPEVGRFISADTTDVLGIQSDLYDKNLYAYCDNNPIMRMDHDGEAWQFALAGGGALASGGMVKIGTAAVLKSISGTILAGVSAVTPAGWFAIGTIVTVSSVVYFKGKTKSKDEVDPYGRAGQKKQGREVKNKSRRKDNFNSRNNKRNKKPAKPKKHTPMDDHRKYK